jgi:Glycine zipper 2TM domain
MRILIISALSAGALALGGCATNRAGEGALVGAAVGAGVGAVSDVDIGTGAAVGAAAGAVIGSQVKKRGCYRRDSNGRRYWDRNC